MTALDSRIRGVETALFDHYRLTPTERLLRLTGPAVGVRVIDIGADRSHPPVLLLHGIASATAAAAPLLPFLAGRRVIALDWPGHGLSDPFVLQPGGVPAHVRTVMDGVLDALGIDVVDLVGHSMGGQFGLHYALAEPARVRRLVLLGAPGAAFAEVRPTRIMRVLAVPGLGRALLRLPISPERFERNTEATLGAGVLAAQPAALGRVGYLASKRPGFARSVSSFFRAMLTPRGRVRLDVVVSSERLASITQPVLLLWGDHDVFLDPRTAAGSIAAIPHSHLHTMPAGHAPWLQHLDECGEQLRDFLGASPA